MDIAKSVDTWIEWCTAIYNLFGGLLDEASTAITKGIHTLPGDAGNETITLVTDSIQGTCYSMLVVFFLIEVITVYLQKGEEMKWEEIFRMLIKLLICKNLIIIAPVILSVLQSTISTAIMGDNGLGSTVDGIVTQCIDLMKNDLLQYKEQAKTGWGIKAIISNMGVWLTVLLMGIMNWFLALIITLMGVIIMAFSFLRAFEMTILAALCGIPLTFYAYSETKDIPKRFLLNYLAVCMQGLVLMVCLTLYGKLLPTANGKFWILIYTGITALGIARSGQWAKDVVGQ